jgi:hypothetical protein
MFTMIIHRTPSSSLLVPCNKWIPEGGNLRTQLNGAMCWDGSGGGFFFTSAIGWMISITSISSPV